MRLKHSRAFLLLVLFFCAASCPPVPAFSEAEFGLSAHDHDYLHNMIYQRECAGQAKNLVIWNEGEDFPSLGMGHFIWFTKEGPRPPYKELFPELLAYLEKKGQQIPPWIKELPDRKAPWNSRDEFMRDQESPRVRSLRSFMTSTVRLQTSFIAERINKLLPKILRNVPAVERKGVRDKFISLARTKEGLFALIDYTHFKGDGLHETERYAGEGWGLLQVLQEMRAPRNGSTPLEEFIAAARTVLRRRVHNAPPRRNESRWLAGWENRVIGYASPRD